MTRSTGFSTQGSQLAIETTPGSPISVTGITKAAAAVVTATNTLVVGDEVEFGAIAGMPEILGLIGVVTVASGSSFTVNIDSSGFATVGTTGTAAKKNWLRIANAKDFDGFNGSATEIDKTHMESDAMEYDKGLEDFGTFTFNADTDGADPGQVALRAAKRLTGASATKAFRLLYPGTSGKRLFKGFVKKFSEAGGTNAVARSAGEIRITGTVNFYP
jgi:hypothetical protein